MEKCFKLAFELGKKCQYDENIFLCKNLRWSHRKTSEFYLDINSVVTGSKKILEKVKEKNTVSDFLVVLLGSFFKVFCL
jgi:hypothetical protein